MATRDWVRESDHDVLEACLARDEGAWRELVTRYGRLLYSIPGRYGFDQDACDDVFQEVFCILVRQLPGIQRRSGLPKWFITTAHRVCRQWARQARRQRGLAANLREIESTPPQELILRWERQHVVHQALRRLGGRCEQLLVALYASQGVASYQEIARKLGIAEGSIGPTRARCLRKLMDQVIRIEDDVQA